MSEKIIFVSGGNQARRLSATPSSTRRVDPETVRKAFGAVKAGEFQGGDSDRPGEALIKRLALGEGRLGVESGA